MICRVPKVGHDVLKGIPRLENVARIVLFQQKNHDGSGYPHDHCVGNDIPAGARILKIVADRLALEAEGTVGSAARHEMNNRAGFYDPELLERVFVCFPGVVSRLSDSERAPLALCLAELSPGQRLHADLNSANGLVLATGGQRLTAMMIERLRNLAEIGEIHEPFLIRDDPGVTRAVHA